MKNDDIDEEAALKHLDGQVKDAEWVKVVKESLKICYKEMKPFNAMVQKKSNFTAAECDVKYDVIVDCMDIASFAVFG